jgi:adenylylsulfate reductase subunit A
MIALLGGQAQTKVDSEQAAVSASRFFDNYETYFSNSPSLITIEQVEETMQKIMDTYAGGIGSSYQFNETGLALAKEKITAHFPVLYSLHAEDMDDLLQIYEIRERLTVCLSLIEHLSARKETRWHSFAENMNYREPSQDYEKYVNSVKENGKIKIILRELVTGADAPLEFQFDEQNHVLQNR